MAKVEEVIRIVDEQIDIDWLQEQLTIISKRVIKVGILGKAGSKILMIANVNEFGINIKVTPKMRGYLASQGLFLKKTTTEIKIPERSFIRKTAYEKEKDIIKFLNKQFDLLFNKKTDANKILRSTGEYCVGITKVMLVSVREPKNHPLTLKGKAPKTNPLINTGTLVNRISYKIV